MKNFSRAKIFTDRMFLLLPHRMGDSNVCMHQLLNILIHQVNEKRERRLYIIDIFQWKIIWCEHSTSPKAPSVSTGQPFWVAHKRMRGNKATQRVISDNLWVRVEEFLHTAVELSTQSTSVHEFIMRNVLFPRAEKIAKFLIFIPQKSSILMLHTHVKSMREREKASIQQQHPKTARTKKKVGSSDEEFLLRWMLNIKTSSFELKMH